MEITCPNCTRTIHLRQEYPYHAGFSDTGFLYCEACPAILKFSAYNEVYDKIVPKKCPWPPLTADEKRRVEERLRPCPCGGRFRFDAWPRCPFCNGNLASMLPGKIYYLEIGTVIDADKDPEAWLPESTVKGPSNEI